MATWPPWVFTAILALFDPSRPRWPTLSPPPTLCLQAREHDANALVADLAVEFREHRLHSLRAVNLSGRGHALAHLLRHPREDRIRLLQADEVRQILRDRRNR